MTATAMFFLKFSILLAGVYVIVLLTPKIAAAIDRLRKPEDPTLEAPRPERVDDDIDKENNGGNAENNINLNENHKGDNKNG